MGDEAGHEGRQEGGLRQGGHGEGKAREEDCEGLPRRCSEGERLKSCRSRGSLLICFSWATCGRGSASACKPQIEGRKYRNQLDHARSSLDHSYENESRFKTEAESYRRDMKKLQDKLEQTEAELRRFNIDRESHLSELAEKAKSKEQDMDKMELEINQLTTERDQLVRQLEKSQDMLLSFQQDLNMA